jgi:hypothetical protein
MSLINVPLKDWPDKDFLRYVENHSQTPRAAFHLDDIRRLVRMSGIPRVKVYDNGPTPDFASLYYEDAKPLIDAARKLIKK